MGEKEMIKAILEGDQKAFKLLVDTYQLMVVNTCHAFVHDRNEAEDIAQDVFIQVFESLGKFRFESKLSTWLYRIAVNRSINHCKSPRGRAIKVDIESWKQQEVAQSVEMPQQQLLEEQDMANDRSKMHSHYEFYVSDTAEKFRQFANTVMPFDVPETNVVNIEEY